MFQHHGQPQTKLGFTQLLVSKLSTFSVPSSLRVELRRVMKEELKEKVKEDLKEEVKENVVLFTVKSLCTNSEVCAVIRISLFTSP